MDLDFNTKGTDICVRLRGELDEYASRALRGDLDKLIETRSLRSMTLDMQGVTFIDSTGLGLVLGRYKKLRAKRAELLLRNVPPLVDKVFRASGVYTYIPIIE